jgi:hypothetical protein
MTGRAIVAGLALYLLTIMALHALEVWRMRR